MTYPGYRRDEVYVNLLEILFPNGSIERIQNFLPAEYRPFYSYQGQEWQFFPFEISNYSSGIDLDATRSEIRLPNLEGGNDLWSGLSLTDFNRNLPGSRVRITYLFLDPDTNDPENGDIFAPRDLSFQRAFSINSVSQTAGVVILTLRNPLNAVNQTFPRRHFSGYAFRELPIDNSPRFTASTTYY